MRSEGIVTSCRSFVVVSCSVVRSTLPMSNPHRAATSYTNVARANPKSPRLRANIEARARWTTREFVRRKRWTYAEMIAVIREQFGIGQNAAQVVYTRARAMFTENADINVDQLVNAMWNVHEKALGDRKYQAAIRAIERMAIFKGLLVKKHEIEHGGTINVRQTMHLQVLALTPIERGDRKKELLAKNGIAVDADDATLDAVISRVLDVDDAKKQAIDVALGGDGFEDDDDVGEVDE